MSVSIRQAFSNVQYIEKRIQRGDVITYGPSPRDCSLDNNVYDCSSFMGAIWGMQYGEPTPGMLTYYTARGFKVVASGIHSAMERMSFISSLQPGDVLIDPDPGDNGHTAMVDKTKTGLIEFTGGGYSRGAGVLYFPWTQIIRSTKAGIGIKTFKPNVY